MTLGQIRNRIQALQLKYAKELAVYRLRRQAEEICHQWERAGGDRQDPPQPEATRRSNENPSFLRRQEPRQETRPPSPRGKGRGVRENPSVVPEGKRRSSAGRNLYLSAQAIQPR